VKSAFADSEIAAARDLSSANSINIGRLLPQMVYYAAASLAVKQRSGRSASFIVPSGNLGNVMACVWARALGLPIDKIVLAHNANRAVVDFLETGNWQPRASIPTLASAMDVGAPSNMERLRAQFPANLSEHVSAYSVSDEEIRARIREDYKAYGRVWCPHSATAAQVYARLKPHAGEQWVLVSTAHPAKFNEIVEPLIGRAVEIPAPLEALLERPSRYDALEPSAQALKQALMGGSPLFSA
jgi:threonine synthase